MAWRWRAGARVDAVARLRRSRRRRRGAPSKRGGCGRSAVDVGRSRWTLVAVRRDAWWTQWWSTVDAPDVRRGRAVGERWESKATWSARLRAVESGGGRAVGFVDAQSRGATSVDAARRSVRRAPCGRSEAVETLRWMSARCVVTCGGSAVEAVETQSKLSRRRSGARWTRRRLRVTLSRGRVGKRWVFLSRRIEWERGGIEVGKQWV